MDTFPNKNHASWKLMQNQLQPQQDTSCNGEIAMQHDNNKKQH
jgi:hypothetical protein